MAGGEERGKELLGALVAFLRRSLQVRPCSIEELTTDPVLREMLGPALELDGRRYESKAALLDEYRRAGVIEVGPKRDPLL